MNEIEEKIIQMNRHIELLNRFHHHTLKLEKAAERYHLFLEVFCEVFDARFSIMQWYHPAHQFSKTLAVKGDPEIMALLADTGMDFTLLKHQEILWPIDLEILNQLKQERTLFLHSDEVLDRFQMPEGMAEALKSMVEPGPAVFMGIFEQEQIIGEILFFLQPCAKRPQQETLELFRTQLSMLLVQELTRDQLADQERRWRFALNSSGDGVWDYDVRAGEQVVSNRWTEMLGYALADIPSPVEFFKEALHPEDRKRVLEKWNRYLEGNGDKYVTTHRLRHRNGHYRWIMSRGKIVERDSSGKPLRIMGTHTDVTKQKQLEEELRKNNETMKAYSRQLEKRVQLKELRLNMLEKLEEERRKTERAHQQKDLLFASLSHDLKNPMSALTGLVDLMLMDETSSEKIEYLELMKQSTQSMLMMLNGLLDFAQLESGRLTLQHQPFDLKQLIDRIWSLHRFKARQKGLEYELLMDEQVPIFLEGDSLRLEQILTNLLNNAIKFTQSGEIAFQVETTDQDHEQAKMSFTVRDTGIGIPPDAIELIFKNYQQASPDIARQYGGSGLGLSISRQLAEKMGGTLRAESREGQGSSFILQVPFSMSVAK